MKVEDWVKWMRKRPDTKARQCRLFGALDLAMPDWEKFVIRSRFKLWSNWRNPLTGKTRLDILRNLSLENFDGINTARLLKVGQQEIEALQDDGAIDVRQFGFMGHGSIIDRRYEIMRPLGAGGCGMVTMVYSHEVEEFFAMKTIRPELLADANSLVRFIQEANLWVDLGCHENIVRAEFIDKLVDEITILMELVDPDKNGCISLQDYILRDTKLSIEQVLKWALGICRGMSHAYSMGIKAHRDLKPDNVLITNLGIAKVTDFGISSLLETSLMETNLSYIVGPGNAIKETGINVIIGTLPYMSPEQFINARECDERSDIYSFGIVLYQLISKGRWPYGDIQSLVKRVHHNDLPIHFFQLHSKTKPKFRLHKFYKIAAACLHKLPGDRPESFEVVESMLLEAMNQVKVPNGTQGEPSYFDPWETGRKAVSLLRLGRYEEALVLFDEILDKFSLGSQWEFDKALTLSKLGRNDEAFALYTKILERDPTHIGALINKGLLCQNSGDLDEAERLYSAALEHHPDDLTALINMGNIGYRRGNYSDANYYYNQVVKLDTQSATGWYNMALACKANALFALSSKCFTRFLECSNPMDSRREYALRNLGDQAD